ncbi:MAG: SEC-C domain-containing protein [Ktedonobacteraceae bacterium]
MDTTDIQAPIQRRDGITASERYLKQLSDRSFLSLWSYSGVYRDQLDCPTAKIGKEVTDLLVVFQNHIIIFSDKDCDYPDGDDEQVNWQRWFKRAVRKSAEQIWGAERWIKTHPQRLFLDPACAQRFPFPLPDPTAATFHRIVVAHGASERCKKFFGGGSGSLIMNSDVIGSAHLAKDSKPFTIGQIDLAKGYVHVFDDTSLEIVMRTLDTVTDFVSYLTKKERFMTSGRGIFVTGEEELLAFYLKDINSDGEHDFIVPANIGGLCIQEGMWEEYLSSPQRRSQIQADSVSYLWDRLIGQFNTHILHGTQYYTSHPGVESSEQSMRFLAREPRTRRRMLAQILLNMLETTPSTQRRTVVVQPSRPGDPHYVFLLLPHLPGVSEEDYREGRRYFLEACCLVTKLTYPQALDIVGIATEADPDFTADRSEDAMYFDARNWTEEMQKEASSIQQDTGLLTNVTQHSSTVREYPYQPERAWHTSPASSASRMKGRDRNKPCFCGSEKKFKKCCGK